MENFTVEASNISEQLGIYDFFNVLVSGFIFILGLSIINTGIYNLLWIDVTLFKGMFVIVMSYVAGIILQELGSISDVKIFKFYDKATKSILKSCFDKGNKALSCNKVIKNRLLLEYYRKLADEVIPESILRDEEKYENDDVNRFVFSVFQYYVNTSGKDKKVERMRALFGMSKTLMACFAVLSFIAIVELLFDLDMPIEIWKFLGMPIRSCTVCIDKVLMALIFGGIAIVFYFRTKRIMSRFLKILLGIYGAIIRMEKGECNKVLVKEYQLSGKDI